MLLICLGENEPLFIKLVDRAPCKNHARGAWLSQDRQNVTASRVTALGVSVTIKTDGGHRV